jgi:ribosomal protein S18 acetylase RimI-like enzyme
VLQLARGLSPADLQAIADLEARTVAADGGRLKLEWGSLRSRTGETVEDLLWWEGDQLLGFLGLYSFGAPALELAGMVDPAARRRGIGTALLDAARPLWRERGYHPVFLVTSRNTDAGKAFALHHGGTPDHSEHAMVLSGDPADAPPGPDVRLRPATNDDAGYMRELLTEGFGYVPTDEDLSRDSASARTLMVEVDGNPVGTIRLTDEGGAGGIYGFVVDHARRGQGIGRAALRQACLMLRTRGASTIGLEVAVENEHALGLYTSVGFTRVQTEDYFALPVD